MGGVFVPLRTENKNFPNEEKIKFIGRKKYFLRQEKIFSQLERYILSVGKIYS